MVRKKQLKKVPAVCCSNPTCPAIRKAFNSRSLSHHLLAHPQCQTFSLRQVPSCSKVDNNNPLIPPPAARDFDSSSCYESASIDEDEDGGAPNGFDESDEQNNAVILSTDSLPASKAAMDDTHRPTPHTPFCAYSTEQIVHLELLQLLDSMGCPDYAFDSIIKWGKKSLRRGYKFDPKVCSRKSQIDQFSKMFHLQNMQPILHPVTQKTIDVEVDIEKEIVTFDFPSQLLSLLSDPELMKPENLQINVYDFRDMFSPSANTILGDCLTGKWYKDTYALLKTCPEVMVIPLIFFTDKTHIDASSRYTLDPFIFTLGIFIRKVREKLIAWRVVGLKDEEHYTKAETVVAQEMGIKVKNYQAQLTILLASIKRCQDSGELDNIQLTIGGQTRIVHIRVPIMYMSADMQEADKICGKNVYYKMDAKRCSHLCDCPGEQADNHNYECKYNVMEEMKKVTMKSTAEEMSAIGMKKINSPFFEMDFGSNIHGIYLACAPDLMHTLEEGVIKHATKVLIDEFLMPDHRKYLDNKSRELYVFFRQTGKKKFPRCSFRNGVTNLAQLKAHEQIGLVFFLVIILGLEDSKTKFKDRLKKDSDYADVFNTFESLLCFHACLTRDKFWHRYDTSCADAFLLSTRTLIKNIVKYLPRGCSATGWKLSKLHVFLHFVTSITMWGSPKNYSTQTGERLHSLIAKPAGHRSQKRNKTFAIQAGKRMADSLILNLVHDRFDMYNQHTKENIGPQAIPLFQGASQCHVSNGQNGLPNFRWAMAKNHPTLPDSVLEFLIDEKKLSAPFTIFTEYNMPSENGQIKLRSNSNFQNEGAWFDWVFVHYERSKRQKEKDEELCVPAKIFCFILIDEVPYAVIHPCHFHSTKISVLLRQWRLHMKADKSPAYDLVSCESILTHCFIFPDSQYDKVIQVIEYDKWSRCFTSAFENIDDI